MEDRVAVTDEQLDELLCENAALRTRLALFETALEHMHHGVCMFDTEGRVALSNRRYAEILRLPPESIHDGTTAR